jgi:alpha/beta superfamily hydrolase
MEEKVSITCGDIELEGLFRQNNTDKGAIITHPHPLYGGDMYNPVVKTIVIALSKLGYATLRFNFRGVGASQGSYDNGEGEQRDLLSAVAFLADRGIQTTALAGYSFGTWVNAKASGALDDLKQMIMISPPVGTMDFSDIHGLPALTNVMTGSMDDVAPPDFIEKRLPDWNKSARLDIIQGADHFYMGYLSSLESVLSTV